MIFTDTDHFVRFLPPTQNSSGDWYIRSVDQDHDGNWFYLAFDVPSTQPMIAKIHESYQLTCSEESDAHYKLFAYYTYHGVPELYEAMVGKVELPSQVMEFI